MELMDTLGPDVEVLRAHEPCAPWWRHCLSWGPDTHSVFHGLATALGLMALMSRGGKAQESVFRSLRQPVNPWTGAGSLPSIVGSPVMDL
jgi:hypothetical protein